MRKVTWFMYVLVLLIPTGVAPAAYTVLNGSKHNVYLIVSTWMESERDIPAGYRTQGYYNIAPGDFLPIDRGNSDYYIRMYRSVNGTRRLIKPSDHETRGTYKFWVRPKKPFMVIEKAKGKSLYSPGGMENLVRTGGFYKYRNGGTFRINGENLEAAKLKKVKRQLAEKKRELEEINQQLAHLTSNFSQVAPAGYTVLNGSTEKVSIIVSTRMESTGEIPAGYRTKGYYKIDPGDFFTINWGSSDYYIRMYKWVNGTKNLIKPRNSATRGTYAFWVVPKDAFTVVEEGNGEILYPLRDRKNLVRTGGFYKYGNIGTFRIRGPHQELAEKEFKLTEINRELQVRQFQLAIYEGQLNEIGPPEVHALLILLGNDQNIRLSVKQNERRMKGLMSRISQYAKVHLTMMTSEDAVTGKITTMTLSAGHTSNFRSIPQGLIKGHQVNDWLNNLQAGQHDTILIYYNGHGEMRGYDDKHILNFDQQTEDEVIRAGLRAQLEQKSGRLKMLITDTCSSRAGTPEFVAKSVNFANVHPRGMTYIKDLFLQHEGILDITAVKPGHYAWGSTDIGGYFTIGLLQSFITEADTNQDRFLTWEEAFRTAQLKTNEFFKQANFQPIDKLKMNGAGQKTQTPVGHSFPARAD